MKHLSEYRDAGAVRQVAAAIARELDADRWYRFMEFCGGHTHAIARDALASLLPENLRFVHGPGCPVCVLPGERVDLAIALAQRPEVILCTYADTLRVPGSGGHTLLRARALGADVRMVYATTDALRVARDHPDRQVVFFAIGFETTAPATAVALLQARDEGLVNFSVCCNHVLTPPAMGAVLRGNQGNAPARVDGVIGPSHVSAIIGLEPYAFVAHELQTPLVVAGFEPLDVLQAVHMLVRQIHTGRCEVENQYTRVVSPLGNPKARALMDQVFVPRPSFAWRGLGRLPHSALGMADDFADLDAERRFPVQVVPVEDHPACQCAAVLRGEMEPRACGVFGRACTPESPLGACMVSSEGACAAEYRYG
ncbi:hydrogenase formation protein HypD [Ectothiorhodospira sp. BSL-9]|uniref:hydrogenase formation protein HypD n=1 Tax=Ectothiorhodospira sp. BSL-9 TaxID=1442136 RepID=UPI0007B43307|nr:hydrogenase formation protein HypD [Ectothiorhodospira sp. BSL-9]ANB02931.1 hydrogenase formation protein HupD [Ectothiorhodospira sp. BSL-9]